MLELNKPSEKSTDSLHRQVEKMLGEKAEAKALKQEIKIECKDIDEVTSREVC